MENEDHTWTANSFTPMLQQTLAVNVTRGVAMMIKTRTRDNHCLTIKLALGNEWCDAAITSQVTA